MPHQNPAPTGSGEPEPRRLRVDDSGELIAVAAYNLGYHPDQSVVVLGMAGRAVSFAAAGDLTTAAGPVPPRALAATLLKAAVNAGATEIAMLGYGPAHTITPVIDAARGLLAAGGMDVVDLLRITDGRYFSYLCRDVSCCPVDGVPFDPTASVVLATAVAGGAVVLPDRAAVQRSIAAVGGAARDAMTVALGRAAQRALDHAKSAGMQASTRVGTEAVIGALERARAGGRLDDDEMASLAVHLLNLDVRDVAWRNSTGKHWQVQLWRDATRRADTTCVTPPATLLAWTAWRRGNGVLARLAVDRALAADPQYTMAALMKLILERAVPPSAIPDWRALVDSDFDANPEPEAQS